MAERVCIIGLDEPEYSEIRRRTDSRIIAHETLPRLMVKDGLLLVEAPGSFSFVPVDRVVFHAIFEEDFEALAALALWGGKCLPNARALMDGRLRLPCLVRALGFSRLGRSGRGYSAPGVTFEASRKSVAKWGNWHCGENKVQFESRWTAEHPTLIEDFHTGRAVRVVLIGDARWQIGLEGDGWLKSIHDPRAKFMDLDPELLDDAERIRSGFGTEILANDYIIGDDGLKHLLEVNLIPNVTRFPEIWEAYREFVVRWIDSDPLDRSPTSYSG